MSSVFFRGGVCDAPPFSCKRQVHVCALSAGAFILMKKEAELRLRRPDLVKSQRRRRGKERAGGGDSRSADSVFRTL